MKVIALTNEDQVRLAILRSRRNEAGRAYAELLDFESSLRKRYFPKHDNPFGIKFKLDEAGTYIILE